MRRILPLGILLLISCSAPHPVPIIEADPECINNSDKCENFADNLKDFSNVVNAFKAYAIKWESVADSKKIQAQTADEITFYGLLVSAIGLATKSPETMIAGATVGAAGTVYSKRYSLEVQSHNYDLASQAMQCLYMATSPYRGRSFPDDYAMRNAALESLTNVRGKLRQLQNSMVLGTPDLAAWQTIINHPLKMPTIVPNSEHLTNGTPVSTEETDSLLNAMKKCETRIN